MSYKIITRKYKDKQYCYKSFRKTKRKNKTGLNYNYNFMYYRAKHRALKKGLEFNIAIEDVQIPNFCPVLRIKLKTSSQRGNRDTSPCIDRVDNTKGYIKGNVCVISNRANRIKSDATLRELELIVEYMKRYENNQ